MGGELVLSTGRRIAFAYVGAILLLLILLPIAVIETMGGHSLMFITLFGAPAGAVLGLIVADRRMHLSGRAIGLRTLVAVGVFLGWSILAWSLRGNPFVVNKGWILIPIPGPLIAAVLSSSVAVRSPHE
jgi:hypothetical protein